ncbi:Site-specific recombinase XerD [Rhodoplanes sp. JGI PP 4-B12]|uniref:tyrosine-type recombinase/integrase n=1 Tax=Rhodoplanes sp. JGI PP 4-B12 TaxID=1873883 RepID=UPI000B6C4BB0|nr:tyrosine-type recombinase/integrase [Rhodoplanes sp. JGI PP 4-B12]SNB54412.1 Site-specific recombinase XerD [Rhodoplanes sp. JGI PP 4-B12]
MAGKWVVRHYVGGQAYEVETLDGGADDRTDADGVAILNFRQAQQKARELMQRRAHAAAGKSGPYTVNNALDDYFKWLEGEGRSARAIQDAKGRAAAFIRPKLGKMEVGKLPADDLRNWRNGIAKSLPRVRTKPGEKQQHRPAPEGATADELEDDRRARRSTANRIWTTLRAALNLAFANEKVPSDAAWRKITPYKGVDKARVRYLEVADAHRLANTVDIKFRPMVQAALLTGGRYGQLARLVVADFNRDAGTVRMASRKGDGTEKVYHVHLTDEGVRFFKQTALDRSDPKSLLFPKPDGTAWQKSDQARPMQEASDRAKIKPAVNFHCLRHTYASHAVMNGAALLVVAQNLGHTDTRMVEKHYGHLSTSYVAEAIRKNAPRFGFKVDSNVAAIR